MIRFSRSKVWIILSLLLLSIVMIGCKKQPTLAFEDTELTVVEEDDFTLTPIIQNLEGTDLVNYTLDVSGIVSYSNGTFTALAEGLCTSQLH
ncbi:MAG: hypothetical protein PHY42_06040 [Bacilli bacterium]|nr:hypothetical protein [Bacilli bacterium]